MSGKMQFHTGKFLFKAFVLALFLFQSFYGYSQNDNLNLANSYYDKDMYKEAREYFQKVVDSGNITGEILYRFAYSNEILGGLNEDTLKIYAAAYSYFMRQNDKDNRYFINAEKKLLANAPNLLELSGAAVNAILSDIKTDPGIQPGLLDSIFNNFYFYLSNISEELLMVLLVFFVIFFIAIYIVALILSYKTKCVIINGWKDLIVLALLSFDAIGLIACFFNDVEIVYITLLSIGFLIFFIWTIRYSIQANIKTIPHGLIFTVLSVLTKVIMLVIIPLIVLLYSYYTGDSAYKTDRRYRDGTKGNTKTIKVAAFAAVVAFLVGGLVKNRKTKIVIETRLQDDGIQTPTAAFKREK
jgi:hypothetical protein